MRSRTRKAPASPCDAWAINPPIGELLRDPKDHCLGSRNLRDGLPLAPCLACNGGPDNCPARPVVNTMMCQMLHNLQLRAGQSPGQTSAQNGGCLWAENLQWRAGQSPSQTTTSSSSTVPTAALQMEGRTIVQPDSACAVHDPTNPSLQMEGRTIVRPDLIVSSVSPF